MSHRPAVDCSEGHVWTGWTCAERTNEAGERCFFFERRCCACQLVEEIGAAIVEPHELRYAKILNAGAEPDD